VEQLQQSGKRPYLNPRRGSNALGTWWVCCCLFKSFAKRTTVHCSKSSLFERFVGEFLLSEKNAFASRSRSVSVPLDRGYIEAVREIEDRAQLGGPAGARENFDHIVMACGRYCHDLTLVYLWYAIAVSAWLCR